MITTGNYRYEPKKQPDDKKEVAKKEQTEVKPSPKKKLVKDVDYIDLDDPPEA